jgi:hypothetical protein
MGDAALVLTAVGLGFFLGIRFMGRAIGRKALESTGSREKAIEYLARVGWKL